MTRVRVLIVADDGTGPAITLYKTDLTLYDRRDAPALLFVAAAFRDLHLATWQGPPPDMVAEIVELDAMGREGAVLASSGV